MKRAGRPVRDPDVWAEEVLAGLRREFERNGQVAPPRAIVLATRDPKLGFFLPRAGEVHLICQNRNEEEKQRFADAISTMIRRTDALAFVFASEAWILKQAIGDPLPTIQPKDHPRREEVIFFGYQRIGESVTRGWSIPIIRPEGKPPTLGEPVAFEAIGGRFTGLMPEVN